MLKVLVIETTVFGYDGITNVIVNYYTYQDHAKVKMDLITINPVNKKLKNELDKNGDQNYVLPYRNNKPLKYMFELKKIIKAGKYDVVHVHGCSATMAVEMLACKSVGVKVRIAHSHNTKCDHIKVDKILRPFFNRWCDYGFACGQEAGEWMFSGKKFDIITNGINIEKFQYNQQVRDEYRKKYNLEDKLVIGHIGRFSEQKNHNKLIDIFESLVKTQSNAKLVLVGDGELKNKIEKRVEKCNLDILFVGLSNEVECWLQAMDIIVFPSLFEGLPLGLVEAQAAGLPCILSDTISPTTKITDLVQFVKLDSAPTEWVDVVNNVVGKYNRAERNEYVKKQIRDSHFDIKVNCKELINRYKELLSEGE